MIRFFRKIRQNLLSEGKTGKYLKYAIGEIVLVVIGILIALQINDWNDERKERDREREVLNQLHTDFKENKRLYDNGKEFYKKKIEGLNQMNHFLEMPEKQRADSIVKNLDILFVSYTYRPSNGLIESLLNSSSIEVIQSDSLKRLIVSWKDVLSGYQVYENILNAEISNLAEYMADNMDFKDLSKNQGVNETNIKAINSMKFQNKILGLNFNNNQLLKAIEEKQLENHLLEIIRLSKIE